MAPSISLLIQDTYVYYFRKKTGTDLKDVKYNFVSGSKVLVTKPNSSLTSASWILSADLCFFPLTPSD